MAEPVVWQPPLLSRSDARGRGAVRYFTGKACKRGHIDVRWTASKKCCTCLRESDRARYQRHRTRRLEQAKKRYAAKRDEIRAYGKRHRAAHREQLKAACRAWHEKNRDHALAMMRARYAANRACYSAANREWRTNNPHRAAAISAAKRARRRAARTGDRRSYTEFVRWARTAAVIKCYHCRRPTRAGNRHLDHVIPLSRGGADSVGNLCVSCGPCNMAKHNKLPEEFAGQAELAL